jgi:sugar/nucleoside kinase (ribokinase family)
MSKILVSGLINLETTLQVEKFPIEYNPVRYPFFGIKSTVSGVGFNLAKALTQLGNTVRLVSLIGQDSTGKLVYQALETSIISSSFVLDRLEHTAESVILYDSNGQRMIFTDLKDIQNQSYPDEFLDLGLDGCDVAMLCNINFSRPFLNRVRQAGKLIATDVHAIASLEDEYNQEFMNNADILFMSHERLPVDAEQWAGQVLDRFQVKVLVIGLGEEGALLAVRSDGNMIKIPAVKTRSVKNTIGAGDALFSCFVHSYLKSGDPYESIRRAVVFASYKIGEAGAADGFLDEVSLDWWMSRI